MPPAVVQMPALRTSGATPLHTWQHSMDIWTSSPFSCTSVPRFLATCAQQEAYLVCPAASPDPLGGCCCTPVPHHLYRQTSAVPSGRTAQCACATCPSTPTAAATSILTDLEAAAATATAEHCHPQCCREVGAGLGTGGYAGGRPWVLQVRCFAAGTAA